VLVIPMLLPLPVLAAADFQSGLDYMREGNYAKAFCLWEPIARLGHPDAQYNLGWLYANGNGLNVDLDSAVHWWQQAAKNGHLDAQFAIGLAYTTGEGIGADLDKAFYWFLSAAKSGHQDSRDIIKRLVMESGKDYYSQYPELAGLDWLATYVVVTGDAINVRSLPGTNGNIIYKASKDEVFRKTAEKNGWIRVILPANEQAESPTGWIYEKLVKTKSGS
jgi:TPR repeat protein